VKTKLLKRDGLGVARAVAMTGFVFGATVSVAGNVLSIRVQESPETAALLFAGVWPLLLLVAIEALSRVPWGSEWYWRLAGAGGAAGVGLLSAIISFQHIRDLLLHWHYPLLSAIAGPLSIDGLMVTAGFGMLAIAKTRAQRSAPAFDPAVRDATWSALAQASSTPAQSVWHDINELPAVPDLPQPRHEEPEHLDVPTSTARAILERLAREDRTTSHDEREEDQPAAEAG
jgi:hypothetical protein